MKSLNGNQLRELRMLQCWFKSYENNHRNLLPGLPNGWTKSQVKLRQQLMELGYLEPVEKNSTFRYYRLTQKGRDFKG